MTQLTIDDLDSSLWVLDADTSGVSLLANYVISQVTARLYHGSDEATCNCAMFAPDSNLDVPLKSLPFSRRTANALRVAGRLDDSQWLWSVTPADFFALKNAGSITLLDFATVVEKHLENRLGGGTDAPTSTELDLVRKELAQVAEKFPLRSISTGDPRLSALNLPADSDLATEIEELLEAAESSRSNLNSVRRTILVMRKTLDRVGRQPLDQALDELLRLTAGRYSEALAARLGWDGDGGLTLQAAADRLGVTRERIRQVEKNAKLRLSAVSFLPALDKAIVILDRGAECLRPDTADLLRGMSLTGKRFLPYGVATAAAMVNKQHNFRARQGQETVELEGDEHLVAFGDVLRSLSDVRHVAPTTEFVARLYERHNLDVDEASARSFLNRKYGVVWLDKQRTWFWDGRSSTYVNTATKILSVSPEISLETLRAGVMRHHRTRNISLPRRIFAGLCRAAGFKVENERVSLKAEVKPEEVLGEIELVFLHVLARCGNVLTSSDLRDACIAEGVNRHSFWLYLSYSPLLERLASGVYALRGAQVDPITVAQLSGERGPSEQALQDHGWTKDRSIWIAYRVTRGVLDSGVISVPAGVRGILGDRQFELLAIDGTEMGTLAVGTGGSAGSAWGLTPFINRRGVDLGDYLLVSLDTELEVAMVQAGTGDLLDSYQEGRGWGPQHYLEEATKPIDIEA